jgi:peroxiredoxin
MDHHVIRRTATMLGIVALLALGAGQAASGKAKIGQAAPALDLVDTKGTKHDVKAYAGRIVVLEWTDPDCPYVRDHYDTKKDKTMIDTYREAKEKAPDLVWLSINSTRGANAAGTQKWIDAHEVPYPVLLDADGKVGRRYGARRAPGIFVIDTKGVLRYAGAIDNNRLGKTPPDEIVNYALETVRQLVEDPDADVKPSSVKPYGCEIKFR